jgi:alpha-beta hydrolase superfamily lysophospholipase
MTRTLLHANVIPMTFTKVRRAARSFALVCSAAIAWSLITPGTSAAAPDGVKPTIVLVHGAWADASSWNGEVDELQAQGYVVRAIANPLENHHRFQ